MKIYIILLNEEYSIQLCGYYHNLSNNFTNDESYRSSWKIMFS